MSIVDWARSWGGRSRLTGSALGMLCAMFGLPSSSFSQGQERLQTLDIATLDLLVTRDPQSGQILRSMLISPTNISQTGLTWDGSRLWMKGNTSFLMDRVVRCHPADGGTQHMQSIGPEWYLTGIESHPITGVLHVMFYRRQPPQDTFLGAVDPSTGALTIGPKVTGAGNPEAIAINSQGVMIMSQASGQKYFQLDYQTGVATLIGNTAIPNSICQDLAFDSQDRLWGVFGDWGGGPHSGIYEIDLSAMTTTKLISTTKYYYGIAFTRDTAVQSYCQAKSSSLGCSPMLSADGLASPAATAGFTIRASNLNNQRTGMLLYSAAGRASLPFQGGTLCLNVPLHRSPASNSGGASLPAQDCSGSFAIDYNELIWNKLGGNRWGEAHATPSPFLIPGTLVQCQYWGRDPGFPSPNNSMLSDAIEFTLAP